VVASMATQQVQSIADLHRQFNELWELESDYKAFYNQLLKPSSPEFFDHPPKAGHFVVNPVLWTAEFH
jgi:hypothetical protein